MNITINSQTGSYSKPKQIYIKRTNYNNMHSVSLSKNASDVFVKSNPSFCATFWKTICISTSAGAAAGSAVGAKFGVTVDLGTGGSTLGLGTLSGGTAGGIVGGVAGAVTGTFKYFSDKNKEKKLAKLEAENAKIREQIEKYEKKDKANNDAQNKIDEELNIRHANAKAVEAQYVEELRTTYAYNKNGINELTARGLDTVAGYQSDKKSIVDFFITPFKFSLAHPERDVEVPNGILFYGLSGNGKSTLAKAIIDDITSTTETNFYDLSTAKTSDIKEKLAEISEKAEKDFYENRKRTIVFMDEFDRFVNVKTKTKDSDVKQAVINFLEHTSENGITVIAATNYPQNIDAPVLMSKTKFPIKTVIEPPSKNDIGEILAYYLNGVTGENEIDYEYLANMIEEKASLKESKYSCSAIKYIADITKQQVKKENRMVNQQDIERIINKVKPDLSKKYMDGFREDFEFMSNGMTYDEYLESKD